MQNVLRSLTPVSILAPVTATQTSEATSAWVSLAGYQGIVLLACYVGVLDAGTLTWTFTTATDTGGSGSAAIVPVDGALTQVTTSNDNPNLQIARFDARAAGGFIQAVGTMAGGAASAGVAVVMFALPNYGI